jgi:hypothetical protein
MRKRHYLYVAATLAVLGGAVYHYTPDAVRWYVEDAYPFVSLRGQVEVVWGGVHFHQVDVTRPGLEASLDLVKVDAEKRIRIEGGEIKLDLDARKGGTGSGTGDGLDIEASGLTVEVHRKGLKAKLEDTTVGAQQVCFRFGTVEHKSLTANVWGGCAQRDKSAASASRVEVPIKLPFKIPRVSQEQVVTVLGSSVSTVDRVVKFRSATLGPFTVVGPATVKLPDDDDDDNHVYFDAPKVAVDHPWVAPYESYFERVSLTAPIPVLRGGDGKFRLRVGRATVHIDPHNFAIHGDEKCDDWLDFLPHPLPEALQQMAGNYGGRMSFEVRAKPIPHLDIKHSCTYTCSAEPIKAMRGKAFTYMAYKKGGELFERKAGPWSPGWVSIADMPPHIPHAFVLLEDPGFYGHTGILAQALENSLKANLAKGEFVKGGSTITMQLAKNLWLRRHKTVGRKAYEALLTVALESCVGKAKILEWYMNVVEYGPDLYGIGAASKHYFRKPAPQLEADEAFYLAQLLPRPKQALPPKHGGLAKAHRLMQILANSGIISEHIVPLKEGEVLSTEGWDVAD